MVKDNKENWLNREEYPFKSQYLETPAGRMHYIDEGKGEVLLFVHGTPTWSFLYRQQIRDLSPHFRCIALDHLGFGLSDKPIDFTGNPEDHARNVACLVEHLDLQYVTLVVHDFGGPIALSYAINNAKNVRQIILFNTWMWGTADNKKARKVDRILKSRLGELLYLNLNFSPKVLLKQGFYQKRKLSRNLHQQYIKPFPDKASRWGLLRVGRALIGSSSWYDALWSNVDAFKDKPVLILWGIHDAFFKMSDLDKWQRVLTDVTIHQLEAGHFVMEEQPKDCSKHMYFWLIQRAETKQPVDVVDLV